MKEKKQEQDILTIQRLYLGNVSGLYYSFNQIRKPSQLDQLEEWFPGMFMVEEKEKREPFYSENEYKIHAWKKEGSFYAGGTSNFVSQIAGRLIGTSKSNLEKGRKDAELLRKHYANLLVSDFDWIEVFQENVWEKLDRIAEERISDFHYQLFECVWDLVDSREKMPDKEKNDEPFPFDDYVYDGLIYNVAYQLHLFSYEGMVNAFLWLLLGGLLRNQVGSLLKMFQSNFTAVNRQMSESGSLRERVYYLFNRDRYYSVYEGEETDRKYPDTVWICDNENCKAILNQQKGFDENLSEWKCLDCGSVNRIDHSMIFENEEDYLSGKPVNRDDYERAVEERKKERDESSGKG